MTATSRHDAWQIGDSYDLYMGRWSRQIAPRFLEWLGVDGGLNWLEVGCGTGALTSAILAQCAPRNLLAIESSEGFLVQARANVMDERVTFQLGDAQSLPVDDASRDVVVSGLVLNFVPDMQKALMEKKRAVRSGGTVAFYVWDYPDGGVEFIHAFWQAAMALDPDAAFLSEDRRFPFCTPEGLAKLAGRASLVPEIAPIKIPTIFKDFEDFWRPFTLGAGPAPGYCASLAQEARQRLKDSLSESLPRECDGSISLKARAWAMRAVIG